MIFYSGVPSNIANVLPINLGRHQQQNYNHNSLQVPSQNYYPCVNISPYQPNQYNMYPNSFMIYNESFPIEPYNYILPIYYY
jgi:hypothetical protein